MISPGSQVRPLSQGPRVRSPVGHVGGIVGYHSRRARQLGRQERARVGRSTGKLHEKGRKAEQHRRKHCARGDKVELLADAVVDNLHEDPIVALLQHWIEYGDQRQPEADRLKPFTVLS